jgi:hypothetical protein
MLSSRCFDAKWLYRKVMRMSRCPANAATSANGRPACTNRLMKVWRSVCSDTPWSPA